ncbi:MULTISPECIES: branched-chain amino acid ABC transporter permease [unclassified Variovorax]|uniref:branched-chain amino acid ABC transporter permease n=1 Tax=unclassified Variovorax TaxID=663243 RepID=UPI000F7DD841|nr:MULTISPECIES: branched-chain amino acid ABC transporter permease [unclassified Variovorax]RSZ42594.1 branched-chain amino acid ABC transporter permease [Variovorax sp. 553]RSZ43569.1 branched-chain amino acid ABC transporter permease [Variovorax sp. 679]
MAWIETIINGVLLGGLYALFGLGLALVFGVMRMVNLAHGEFVVLAAYFAVFLATQFPGVSPLLFIVPVALAAFGTGYLLQRLLLNRAVATDDPLTPVLVTFGIAVVLRNLMAELFGADPRALDGGALATAGFEIGGLRIGWYPVLVLVLAVLAFGALQWLLQRSRFGLIVRATSDHREMVRTMGVRPAHVYGVVMGLSLAFASVAGLLLALRTSFTPFSGVERLLGAFEVVIIGGMGSFRGALVGGIALGVAQLAGQRLDSNAGALYAHLLFFVVLMVRPNGIAGPRS